MLHTKRKKPQTVNWSLKAVEFLERKTNKKKQKKKRKKQQEEGNFNGYKNVKKFMCIICQFIVNLYFDKREKNSFQSVSPTKKKKINKKET